jgi:hypothetical protein
MTDFTASQINQNSFLATLTALDPTPFLATYQAMPCLIKGVEGYGDDAKIVISPGFQYYSRLGNARVANNKIKFCYGSEQLTADRADCYEFGVVRVKVSVISEVKKQPKASFPLVLTREHNDDCPVCMEKLTGDCVECSNKHQFCLPCYDLIPLKNGVRTCALCRVGTFSPEEVAKIEAMTGKVFSKQEYLATSVDGCNSFKMYRNSEALFLGMVSYVVKHSNLSPLQKMTLSAFHDFYTTHPDAFSTWDFNILAQYNGNDRRIKTDQDLGEAWNAFLAVIESPKIYNNVGHTDLYPFNYTDNQYYNDLESITGSLNLLKDYTEGRAIILKRQMFFRAGIRAIPENARHKFIFGVLESAIRFLKSDTFVCDKKTTDTTNEIVES